MEEGKIWVGEKSVSLVRRDQLQKFKQEVMVVLIREETEHEEQRDSTKMWAVM